MPEPIKNSSKFGDYMSYQEAVYTKKSFAQK